MAENLSLWEFLRELVTNTGLRDRFAEDPQGALRANGLDHLSPDDVHDALVLAEDNQTAEFSRDYDAGHSAISWSPPAAVVGESEHEAAVRYLNSYITSNSVDHPTDPQIHGGAFDQDIDVHSAVPSGDGAVAAGGNTGGSTITTGVGDQVGSGHLAGDGNAVGSRLDALTGDHDTTAFGAGTATGAAVRGDVSVGGAFASGGSATVDDADGSQHDVGDTAGDNSVHDSFQDSSDHSVDHSFTTHGDAGTHDSFDDDSVHTTSHSFDDESDHSTHMDNGLDHVGDVEH